MRDVKLGDYEAADRPKAVNPKLASISGWVQRFLPYLYF